MDRFTGKWSLKENNNFNNFLLFTQLSWIERMVALTSPITLFLTKNNSTYTKKIESLFYNAEEKIILDNRPRLYNNITKTYSETHGCISVEICGEVVRWNEKISLKNNDLVIEYTWNDDGTAEKTNASQIFTKS